MVVKICTKILPQIKSARGMQQAGRITMMQCIFQMGEHPRSRMR
jgi:hypothetical protein